MSLDLFQTGTLVRCPGGGPGEDVAGAKANGVKWFALNIGSDPCVKRDPGVWGEIRKRCAAAGMPVGPWQHCHSIDDVDRLIAVGEGWEADFIGCNVEDVVGEKLSLQEVGGHLLDFWVNAHEKPVHMPSLPWLENGQGWQHVDFAYIALEMFPEVDPRYLADYQGCINHAFAEGAKRVTLLYSTQSPRSMYPNVAHCLYTADNAGDWSKWHDDVPQTIPIPPTEEPPVSKALTPTQKKKVRDAMVLYCQRAEQYRMNRGYSQRRPVIGYGLSARGDQLDDCSGFVSKVFYKAIQVTGIHLLDPLGFHFSGIGNTESIQTTLTHAAPKDKYLPGDVALWGPNDFDTSHTAICRKAGTGRTAIFTSHGHQSWRFADDAPEGITLVNFPEHLIGVYRHPALR